MPVEEEDGSSQGFRPITRRHGGVNQQGADHVVESAQHPLSFAILGRGVRARGAKQYAAASEEGGIGVVDELVPLSA